MSIPTVFASVRRLAVMGLFVLSLASPGQVTGQEAATPATVLRLDDMRGFKPTAGNWQIVGGFMADRAEEHAFATRPGTGVLANIQTDTARDNLFTAWEHADIELDLDVNLPRGSNSGIYLQGRYEVQLFDSWGVAEPSAADLGGIYQRWDESRPEGQKGYEGHPPPINVARAPGLWQHLHIVFRAPRFDAAGKKIRNAAFVQVALNGIVLHENVELTGPTRSSAWDDEAPLGPLMIQGDHGPVALRHISYRLYRADQIQLTDLRRAYYTGRFDYQMPDLAELDRVEEGPATSIDAGSASDIKQFALQYAGSLQAPVAGDYVFEVAHTARVRLEIDGKTVLTDRDPNVAAPGEFDRRAARVRLTKGAHRLVLTYAKGNWHAAPTALGFYVSGPGLLRTELTAPGSLPADAFAAFEIAPQGGPLIQRNFVVHGGEKRTHAMSVGEPTGIHYAYDMGSGALLSIWKGRFVNTSPMWYERGEMQSAIPLGSLIELAGWPTVAVLSDDSAPWPEGEADYHFSGYSLAGERPVFSYETGGVKVLDQLTPDEGGTMYTRRIALSGKPAGGKVWVFVAEGDAIEMLPGGAYAVDNQRYYIEHLQGGQAYVRNVGGKSELLVGVELGNGGLVSYDLVW
ncbi:MAG: family 16 glycoside hydrolase [Rhodothermales bacterium]